MRSLTLALLTITSLASSIECSAETNIDLQRLARDKNNDIYSSLISEPGSFGKSCAAILSEDKIYDQYQKLSGRYRVEQFYNWACHSNFQSASDMKEAGIKLKIPLEGLPIPLGLDGVFTSSNFKESLSQWCATAWSTLTDQATYEEFSRVVDSGMVSAYKSCIDAEKDTILKQYGVFAYAIPQDSFLRKFLINIEFRSLDFEKPKITSIEGSDISCTIGGNPITLPYTVPTSSLSITCTKATDDSRIISFNTGNLGSSPFANLPGLLDGIIKDIDQRTKGLAQSMMIDREATRNKLNVTNARFDKVRFNATACMAIESCGGAVPACPAGFKDTGFMESDTRGGGKCGYGRVCRVCYTVDP